MTKQKKLSKIAITAAVGAAAIVVPSVSQASEVALTPAKVAFNVDGQIKIITAEEYINAIMGAAPEIRAAITNTAGEITPASVNIGGKYISAEDYIVAYMSGNAVTQEEIDATVAVSTEGAQELVNGEWKPVDPAPITELKVDSVSAITETVYNQPGQELKFAINGGTQAADVAALTQAGYTVKYLSTTTETDGKVDGSKIGVDKSFGYQVEISNKDGKVVATSAEKTVKVIDVAAAAEITKHKLEQEGKEVATVVVGKNAQITVAEYKTVAGKDVKSTEKAFDLTGVTFKSSNTAVAVVDSKGEIIPLREGTATITVSKAGMKDYTISVTVKAEARVATTVTGLENIELSVSETVKDSKTVKVVVKDQYGDNKEITDFTVESSDAAVTVDTSSKTATNGEASFTVKAVKAGTSVITIKDGKKVLGTATVTVKAASAVASYNLELASGKDTTLDLATATETDITKQDTVLELDFVSRDAAGLLVGKLGEDTEVASANQPVKTYTVESSDKEVAEVTVDSTTGKFVVTGKKVGKTTITVKQGTITRTSLEVTVVDTTKPTVTAVGGTSLAGKDFDDVLGENAPFGTALTLVKDADDDATTLTLSYDASKPLGQLPTIAFNDETKVSSIAVNGTELSSDELAQLIIKTGGTNFVTQPQKSITLQEITGKFGEDLAKLGTKITITLENLSGYTTTYTVNLVKEEAK